MATSVLDKIIPADLCCGCGTCAGICPVNALEVSLNRYGEYNPHLVGNCTECRLCLNVCPFNENTENQLANALFPDIEDIKKDEIIGYYNSCFLGHAEKDNIRKNAASGGMVTYILNSLLLENEIDSAVVVAPSDKQGVFFDSQIVHQKNKILKAAKSKYYPVELSKVLRYIKKHDGRYAIVALPCQVYGLRKAQKISKPLRERIKYIIGLTCGHGVSSNFTEFLIDCAGVDRKDIKTIDYRDKTGSKTARDFSFTIELAKGNDPIRISFLQTDFGKAWTRRMFSLRACDFCDDVFAELADASCMDAWLKDHIKDPKGGSIVVVRNKIIFELLNKAIESKGCKLEKVDADTPKNSQPMLIDYKRNQIAKRILYAEKKNEWIPSRRCPPEKMLTQMDILCINILRWNRWISRHLFSSLFFRKILGRSLVDLCPNYNQISGRRDMILQAGIFLKAFSKQFLFRNKSPKRTP